jgi:hypothetical protein
MKNSTTYSEMTPTRSRRNRSQEICQGDRPRVTASPDAGALNSGPDVNSWLMAPPLPRVAVKRT